MSFGKAQSPRTNAQYIRNLIEMGHESVLEHVSWTFIIAGISRAFTHQLVRHRVGISFSQLSQQYHDESETNFVEPSLVRRSKACRVAWQKTVMTAKAAYTELLQQLEVAADKCENSNAAKEQLRAIRTAARSVLPNATETTIVVTANARALRTFLKLRGAIVGDEEMRIVSSALLSHLRVEAPSLFEDFVVEYLPDQTPIVRWRPNVVETPALQVRRPLRRQSRR
jgi:thymidylate synthase (FAD)